MKRVILLTAICVFGVDAIADDLTCLTESERVGAKLYAHLQREAYTALDRRDKTYEQLKTPDQIRAHQQELREFFIRQLGGFPERTPLNARTVRTIKADGYNIENVIFESQRNHHVTANLYLPESQPPVPGVVVSSGHSRTAKTADYSFRDQNRRRGAFVVPPLVIVERVGLCAAVVIACRFAASVGASGVVNGKSVRDS